MATYPLPTLSAQVTSAGISAPAYSDILLSLQASFRAIYGSDAYLEADSQDGQFLAIMAQAINDCNQSCIATYNAFSPSTAQGNGLSSVVKINGIARNVATNSTVSVTLTGVVGSVITGGKVADINGAEWNLPPSVTIGAGGVVTVTATAAAPGAVSAAVGSVTVIRTPTLGWQSVTNPSAATPGAPVETDVTLRERQTESVAIPSLTVLQGCTAAVKSVTGVTAVNVVENDQNTANADGVPAHSVAYVVAGGDNTAIATAIYNKKGPGAGTYGTTSVVVTDAFGTSNTIYFYRPTITNIYGQITIRTFGGYLSTIGERAKQSLVDYINGLSLGADVLNTRLYVPFQLYGAPEANTFEVVSILTNTINSGFTSNDISIPFYGDAQSAVANFTIIIVP
jgi:uncharacterized phage protein gp47/JayE